MWYVTISSVVSLCTVSSMLRPSCLSFSETWNCKPNTTTWYSVHSTTTVSDAYIEYLYNVTLHICYYCFDCENQHNVLIRRYTLVRRYPSASRPWKILLNRFSTNHDTVFFFKNMTPTISVCHVLLYFGNGSDWELYTFKQGVWYHSIALMDMRVGIQLNQCKHRMLTTYLQDQYWTDLSNVVDRSTEDHCSTH